MNTYIEQLGGSRAISEYIRGSISLQSIAKKNGIKRFGPATEKKVLEFYNKYYNSDSISDKITANFHNIKINPHYFDELNKYKTEIESILSFLNGIDCGSWYKEDIIESIIDIISQSIGSSESINTRERINDIFNVEKDPILLKKYIPGIHLDKVDRISLDNGWWKETSQQRYDCYSLDFVQRLCENSGHVYFSKSDMDDFFRKNNSFSNINVDLKSIHGSIERLIYDGYIFQEKINGDYYFFYRDYHEKEKEILHIISECSNINYDSLNLKAEDYSMEITEEQVIANNGISENCISFLNGPGGTGKTGRCIKGICDQLCSEQLVSENDKSKKVLFTAPTHAAKKNGKDSIGYEKNIDYSVLHSLLYTYFNEEGEEMNSLLTILRKNETEYIAVDETSMVDMLMFYELLITVKKYLDEGGTIRLVFMGDENQLEPIGIGNPYISLLNKVPQFKLSKNFRSNENIIGFCDMILNNGPKGKEWYMDGSTQKNYKGTIEFDFTDYETEWKEKLEKRLYELKGDDYTPYEGEEDEEKDKTFQVICPWNYTNPNNITKDICKMIRRVFKGSDSKDIFEIGDVIIMNQNVKGVFYNNDLGKIVDITVDGFLIKLSEIYPKPKGGKEEKDCNHKGHRINILPDNHIQIPLTYKDATKNMFIKPNYSRTVHSMQGLQFSQVLYVVPKQGGSFINIKMNYTAYSRAQDKLYLIGNKSAFDAYYSKNPSPHKNTTLPFDSNMVDSIQKTLNGKSYTRIFENSLKEKSLQISKSIKYQAWGRDNKGTNGRCNCCQKKITIKQFYVSPIDPEKKYDLENLKCICSKCFSKDTLD